jgi:hypothetical protein
MSRACKKLHNVADNLVRTALKREKDLTERQGEEKKFVFLDELVKVTKDPIVLRSQLLQRCLLAEIPLRACLEGYFGPLLEAEKSFKAADDNYRDVRNIQKSPGHHIRSSQDCSYFQYTIHETLRPLPPIQINVRQATKETSLPCGGRPDGMCPTFV